MKKILVLLFALSMVLLTAIVAQAEGIIYFDLGGSGSSTNKMNLPDLPLSMILTNQDLYGASEAKMNFTGTSGYLIGGEYDFNPFKVVVEYTCNTFENDKTTGTYQPLVALLKGTTKFKKSANSDLDYTSNVTLVKGCYRLINSDQFKLYGELGYLGLKVSGMSGSYKDVNFTNGGPLIGLNGSYDFSKQFSINVTYGMTVGASPKMKVLEDLDPDSKSSGLVAWRIKGLYTVNEQWAVFISYSDLSSSLRYKYNVLGDVKIDSNFHGIAVGTNYKF